MADGGLVIGDAGSCPHASATAASQPADSLVAQRRFDDFSRLIAGCLWETDADLKLTWLSERSVDVFGVPARAVVGRRLVEIVTIQQAPGLGLLLDRRLPLRETPCRVRGDEYRLLINAVPVFRAENGVFAGYRGTIVENRPAAAPRINDVVADLIRVFEDCPLPVMITGADGTILHINPRLEVWAGCSVADVAGNAAVGGNATDASQGDDSQTAEIRCGRPGADPAPCLRRADGQPLWRAHAVIPIGDGQGQAVCSLAVGIEAAPNGRFEERLRHQAHHDALTGLPNRLGFLECLSSAVADARRRRRTVALVSIDIDRFKAITDAIGAAGGDEVLRRVAARLGAWFVTDEAVGRLAGDEFAVIVADPGDRHDVEERIATLAARLAEPMAVGGQEFTVHVSIGIAVYPHDGEDAFTLLKNAATALQQAKDTGGNAHQFFAPIMDDKARPFIAFGQRLRQALPRRQFELHYQPLVELRSGTIVGAEALLRWRHPDLGLVPPANFIALAEESGLIERIGEWVFGEALRQGRRWQDQGLTLPTMAVNVSARQLQRGRLRATVVSALEDAGLPPAALCIEITESAVLVDADAAKTTLDELDELGVAISVDDFGTGYSWLTYLRQLPLSTLKIDRAFIRDFNTDADAAAIVDAIIVMAHRLGLQVVAEGVRNGQQVDILRLKGCEMMQGFYFSPPLTADEFTRLLKSGRRLTPMIVAC